ncbi:coagulation factor X-like isoform X2 [Apostichopus japonicus]|uniref:coagulation factor X-like isoform X2 n=1 Tax=Stichopus japonicus TaxID=307972 RepID=UPI003AB7080B
MGIITGQNTITGWHCLFVVLLYTMARTSGDTRYACDNETYSSGGMCEDDSNLTYVCCDPDTEINECESLPCANNATCNDAINGFTCTCMDGFEGQLCQFHERRATFFEVFIPHVLWLTALIISNLITAGVIWAIWARRNANRPT